MPNIDLSHMAVKAPPNPSKYDIIPIHSSDRAAFKFCRRKWAWSSPARLNLVPKSSVFGVQENLWFGTGIHYALERYYNPLLREHPAIAFAGWFDIQWLGGTISPDEVKEYSDRNPVRKQDGNYKVDGLGDILTDPDAEETFLEYKDLGIGMMNYYVGYAEENDNFAVISTEHDFSVPVLSPDGEPLYWQDTRTMPDGWEPNFDEGNEFGPYMREKTDYTYGRVLEKQVHVRGRSDVIVQDQEHGRYGIRDYKTAATIGQDYFRHLELDEQCTSYLTFCELEARINNLEYRSLEYIDYVALLKAYPKPPTFTSRGLPSLDRQKESTTAAMFEKAIKDSGLDAIFAVDPKMQNYYTWLLQNEDRFIQITPTWRNSTQRKNAGRRLYYEAIDMLNSPVLYPNPSKNYSCLNCIFRTPCLAAEDGSDYMEILNDGYMPNWDR